MTDVYYEPEAFGLILVGDFNWGEASYDFDIFAVWQDSHGQLYYGEDSGCSCPSPFETYTSLDNLTPCTLYSLTDHLNKRLEQQVDWGYTDSQADAAKVYELLAKVANLHFSKD